MCDRITYCDVCECAECPKYGDDCDGDKRNDDLISRADAIEAVCDVVMDEFNTSATWGYDVAEKALSALPSAEPSLKAIKRQIDEHWYLDPPSAEAVQGWIPCSERLPLASGEFLVTLVDHDGAWVSTAQWNMTFGGRWQDIFPNDGYRDISNVIAWKTLPIPYREDGEA